MRISRITRLVGTFLIVLLLQYSPAISMSGNSGLNASGSQVESVNFDGAWMNYKHAFNPIRDAVRINDYKSLKQHMPHFKDRMRELKESNPPREFQKPLKKILKLSKGLVKVAQQGNRSKISDKMEKLRIAIDKFDQRRMQGK